jgi:hypothetical protein
VDPRRFDSLTRSLAAPKSRRGFLGTLAALGAGLGARRAAGAQVTQAQCGNVVCYNRSTQTVDVACSPGCVCCVFSNGNSRCMPPGNCSGVVTSPTTTTTTAAPTTTTTTTAPPRPACIGDECSEFEQDACCAGTQCFSSACCIPFRDVTIPDPAACVASAECCQNPGGTVTCQADGRCCASLGAHCDGSAECCTGVCDLDARACVTCLGAGVFCYAQFDDCCAGLACVGDQGFQRCQPTT